MKSRPKIMENFYDRFCDNTYRKRIFITPILDFDQQVNNGFVDLRLGTEFILTRKTKFTALELTTTENKIDRKEIERNIKLYQTLIRIDFGKHLVLHPNQFILGCTLEYIKLPDDIYGYIIGRSSWGRLGLIIATATLINPGFAGVITLELTNLGEVPINLYPGLRIAQISLHKIDFKPKRRRTKGKSKYFGSISPNFSKIYEDNDIKKIIEKDY